MLVPKAGSNQAQRRGNPKGRRCCFQHISHRLSCSPSLDSAHARPLRSSVTFSRYLSALSHCRGGQRDAWLQPSSPCAGVTPPVSAPHPCSGERKRPRAVGRSPEGLHPAPHGASARGRLWGKQGELPRPLLSMRTRVTSGPGKQMP